MDRRQNALMDSESRFADDDERRRAFVAYYALVSWMDHNVGRILGALEESGLADDTVVIYSSDHGDNVGARGLWGKSNMYEIGGGTAFDGASRSPTGNLRDAGVTCRSGGDDPGLFRTCRRVWHGW